MMIDAETKADSLLGVRDHLYLCSHSPTMPSLILLAGILFLLDNMFFKPTEFLCPVYCASFLPTKTFGVICEAKPRA